MLSSLNPHGGLKRCWLIVSVSAGARAVWTAKRERRNGRLCTNMQMNAPPIDATLSSMILSSNPAKSLGRGGRAMPRLGVVVCAMALLFPVAALCDTVNIGFISYDVFIPGGAGTPGTNVFNISNFTGDPSSGGFALPPDF